MNKKLNIIIVDDSMKALKLLSMMIQELDPDINIIDCINNPMEVLKSIKQHRPDAVFLDIEMPQKSGLVLAQEMLEHHISSQIIFVTAYNQYAIDAFRLSAVDYLLKPVEEKHLKEAIFKLKNNYELKSNISQLQTLVYNLENNDNKILAIPIINGYEYIPIQDIEFIEAEGSYSFIHLINNKRITVSKNLRFFEEKLQDQKKFIRVHRSYLINIQHIQSYSKSDRGVVVMKNTKKIKISRERKQLFFEIMKQNNIAD